MGAAFAGRDGVAVGAEIAVAGKPGDRPFDRAMAALLLGPAGEDRHDGLLLAELGGEVIGEAARKVERRLLGNAVLAVEELGCALPADLDPAEEVGLGAGHGEQALGLEGGALAEDVRVRLEADARAAPVMDLAELLQLLQRRAAREALAIELPAARDLDLERLRQGVDHRHADAVQAARRLVDLRGELPARMQHGHDDFERRLGLELRMRIDRNAAAIVGDGEEAVGANLDLDPGGVAGDRLVHAVVDHLGEEVMQRLLVGAADIHARPPADRLEPLEDLDVGRRIALGLGADGLLQRHRLLAPGRLGDLLEIAHLAVECGEQVLGLGRAFGHRMRGLSKVELRESVTRRSRPRKGV